GSAPQTLPVEKRFLHAASAQRSCFRASAAATLPPNSRSPRNVQPSRAATHRLQQLQLRVPADHQNRTSASPAPATENQCTKIRSSLTLWESRRFKSDGNRYRSAFPWFESYQAASASLYDQVWMTGWRFTSSMPAIMRSLSSCFEVTRMWRRTDRANLEKKPSMRLSHEPCLGVKVNSKRPGGRASSQAVVSLDMCAE